MKARFAPLLSRLSIISVVAVSALGATACGRAQTSTASNAPVDEATQAVEASGSTEAQAPAATPTRGMGHHIFKQVAALGLRDDQTAAVAEIEANLAADMAPHHEMMRQVAKLLADGIEAGRLDPADAAAQQAALAGSVVEAKASFASAINDLHDVLDADQRAELVARLQAQHQRHAAGAHADNAEHANGPIAKLALTLGLDDGQQAALRDEVRKHVEAIFPERKERRLEGEARMKALAEAFVTDDFDAADFDMAGGAEQALESFSAIATHAIDISGRVLTAPQRQALAALIRTRAAEHG